MQSSVLIRCRGFETPERLQSQIRSLLDGTRGFFQDRGVVAFYTDEVRVLGIVPDGTSRHVGQVVEKRLLSRVKVEDRQELPGLTGAGLRPVGDGDDYHWHASIEAPHGAYDSLALSAQLMFAPGAEPPPAGPDLDAIEKQVETGCDFVRDRLQTFATKLFR